jgi:lysophospholipase L1-like esterase
VLWLLTGGLGTVAVSTVAVAKDLPSAASAQPALASSRADQPAPQGTPIFLPAHAMLLAKAQKGVIDVYFLGDSITRRWQGTDYPVHKKNWDANFFGWNAANFGWGADTTRNVLWRLQHGELDGVNPKVIVLLIGTNNVGQFLPTGPDDAMVENISNGIKAILEVVMKKAPGAKVVLMAITPRNDNGSTTLMPAIEKINSRISQFADGKSVVYLNINHRLADGHGRLFAGLTEDGLHLSTAGYQIWADALKPILAESLGPPANIDQAPPASGIPVTPSAAAASSSAVFPARQK